jgi:L-asparaginase
MTAFLDNPDDLSHLKLIDAKSVEEFLSKLNAYNGDKKLVAAIGTGGTISMKVENGVRVPDLDFDSIFKQVGNTLENNFDVLTLDAFCIASPDMNYSHVRELAIVIAYIGKNIKVPFMGFLITHGTDTMAFSAAALSLIMGQGLPFSIAYTGAQKPIQEKMSDAGQNIIHSLYTLESLSEKNMAEVVIVMGDRAILGTSSMKVHDALADAFDAPLHHYVANFSALEYPVRIADWLKEKRNTQFFPTIWKNDYSQTLVVHSSLGLCPERVKKQASDESVKAILLFSYGAGTANNEIIEAIMDPAQQREIPVFVIKPVHSEYKAAYESGKKLIENGVTPLYMTLPTALAKIEIALGFHQGDKEKIADFMTTNYVGEIPSEESRFSPILER